MEINFKCPSCGVKLALSEEFAGGEVRCPKCGATSTAPAPAPPEPAAPVAAPARGKPAGAGDPGPAQRRCPACSELYDSRAAKCPHCNEWFDDAVRAKHGIPSADLTPEDDSLSAVEWILAIVCSGLGCIVGIVYICQGNPKGKKLFLISLVMNFIWFLIQASSKHGRF